MTESRGRVAMLLPSLVGGGAERVFCELARGLLAQGFLVDIVVVRAVGELLDEVPEGARVVDLGARRTAFAGRRLLRYLRTDRPDVMFSALDPTNALNVVVQRVNRSRVPAIVTQHNTMSMVRANAHGLRERLVIAANRRLFLRAERVVAVSGGVADDLAATFGIDRAAIDVAYNPVISARNAVAAAEPVPHPWLLRPCGPVLLALGRLTAAKDFPTLLRALARLPADHRLVLLGEGPARAELEALALELGIADRVDIHGFVVNPFPFLAAADVVVLSSRWEGLPTVLIEALPFRCGIVATDCPSGPREILDGGRLGRLVPVGDAAALAAAIGAELAHPRVRPPEAWRRYEIDHAVGHYARLVGEVVPAGN